MSFTLFLLANILKLNNNKLTCLINIEHSTLKMNDKYVAMFGHLQTYFVLTFYKKIIKKNLPFFWFQFIRLSLSRPSQSLKIIFKRIHFQRL